MVKDRKLHYCRHIGLIVSLQFPIIVPIVALFNGGQIAAASVSQTFSGPGALVFDSSNQQVYVGNGYQNNVKVVSDSTNTIIKSIHVGPNPNNLLFNPKNLDVLVGNGNTNTISIINGSSNKIVSTIYLPTFKNQYGSFPFQPYGLAYDSNNGNIYVVAKRPGWGTGTEDTAVYEIDSVSQKILAKIDLGNSADPGGIAFDGRNGDLYVGDQNRFVPDSHIDVINTTTNKLILQIYNRGQNEGWAFPSSIVVDSSNGNVYVANSGAGNIRVISDSNNTILTTIHVGSQMLTFDSTEKYLYDADGQTLNVIDPAENALVKSITLWQRSSYCSLLFNCAAFDSIAFDSHNNQIYVGISAYGIVGVVDSKSASLVKTIRIDNVPDAIAFNPNDGRIYVANTDSDNIAVIDGSANNIVKVINLPLKSVPSALLFLPINDYLYLADLGRGSIDIIDLATYKILSSIPVGDGPLALAYNPVNKQLYVANYYSNSITAIDTTNNKVVTTIPNILSVDGLVFDTWNHLIYASTNGDKVFVINGTTNSVSDTIQLNGSGTAGITYNPFNKDIYVANAFSNSVTVIDSKTNAITEIIAVGTSPTQLAVNGINHEIYITNIVSNTISIINATTNNVATTDSLANPSGPDSLAFDYANGFIFCTDAYSSGITVLDASNNILKTIHD